MFGEERSWDYSKSHSAAIRILTSAKVTAGALQRHLIRRRFYFNGRATHYTVDLYRQPRSMTQRETQTERKQNLHIRFLQQNNFEWLGQAEADVFYYFNISVLREDIFIIFLSFVRQNVSLCDKQWDDASLSFRERVQGQTLLTREE